MTGESPMTTRTNKLTNLVAATLVSAASVTVSADMTGSITSLSHGYEGVVLAEKRVDEGRCGEGKCGASSTSVKTEEGLGLRREHLKSMASEVPPSVQFLEVAPENWIKAPRQRRQQLEQILEQTPLVCHGLSLSLGGPTPLDMNLLREIKTFLQEHRVVRYTEHLSYCSDQGHLYDLMPIPFTEAAAHYVADRIKQTQDFLGEPVAVENVSYYCAPGQQMPEIEFINSVLELAD
ncbi:hypothetical protein CAPTEDRAFT_199574, partial [Capitella teleta]